MSRLECHSFKVVAAVYCGTDKENSDIPGEEQARLPVKTYKSECVGVGGKRGVKPSVCLTPSRDVRALCSLSFGSRWD